MPNERQINLLWASSYDRGLQYLLFMWSDIKKKFPQATLHCAYGWDTFLKIAGNNPERMAWKDKMDKLMDQDGIFHYGRVNKKQLKELRNKCGILAYSTDFFEINCHPAGTYIFTENGDIPIEKISLSDRVLTSQNRLRNITAIRSREHIGSMYEFIIQAGSSVKMTGEHPVLIIKSKQKEGRSWKERINDKKEWIEAKDVSVGDIVVTPRLKKQNNFFFDIDKFKSSEKNNFRNTTNNPNGIFTKNTAWLMGYFAGDGTASRVGQVSFLIANSDRNRLETKMEDSLKEIGFKSIIKKELDGCVQIMVCSHSFSRWLRHYFYDENSQKKIPMSLVVSYPEEILQGLIDSDGTINENYSDGRYTSFTNTSRKLVSMVRYMMSYIGKSGKLGTYKHQIGKESFAIGYTDYQNQKQQFYAIDDDFIYLRIRDIKKSEFSGLVYNIDVEEDHDYLANGTVVHNCITVLECQSQGCVPVVMNQNFKLDDGRETLTALDETVYAGVKVPGDIREETGRKMYLDALILLMGNEDYWKKLSKQGIKGSDKYKWDKIAGQWSNLFNKPLSEPFVSIITPTIRQGFWNLMAENISKQTYKNIEWIVVDDFKDDRSKIMKQYCDKYGVNGKYVRGKGKGQYFYGLSSANNVGWKNANGELLVYLQDFMLMPSQGIEVMVDIYRHNPNALIAPTDINCLPSKEPNVDSEDWFNGETDIIGEVYFDNPRNKKIGMRTVENPFDFEMNYCAVPRKIVEDIGGWYEFFNDALGYDNTEFAYRALLAGYKIIVDDTNQAIGINHWDALKEKPEQLGEKRTVRLNDPRYYWMINMIQQKRLPYKRVPEKDGFRLEYEIPQDLGQDEAVAWMKNNIDKIIYSWENIL